MKETVYTDTELTDQQAEQVSGGSLIHKVCRGDCNGSNILCPKRDAGRCDYNYPSKNS